MTFLSGGTRESIDEGDDTQLPQPDEKVDGRSRYADVRIHTAYTPEQLQSRLLATYCTAGTTLPSDDQIIMARVRKANTTVASVIVAARAAGLVQKWEEGR